MNNLKIIISNSSKEPIYSQIYNQIKNKIIKGVLAENYPLPSIRFLAKELKVSVITTKRAYDDLEREGFIYTVVGKGSYVSEIDRNAVNIKIEKEIEEDFKNIIDKARKYGYSDDKILEMVRSFIIY
jgi:GntR family transcriptional regulator